MGLACRPKPVLGASRPQTPCQGRGPVPNLVGESLPGHLGSTTYTQWEELSWPSLFFCCQVGADWALLASAQAVVYEDPFWRGRAVLAR